MCKKRQWKCQAGKGWIFLGAWKKTKGLALALFALCQEMWPLPQFIHFLAFLVLSPNVLTAALSLSEEGCGDDSNCQREVKNHRRKYLKDSNLQWTIWLPTLPPHIPFVYQQ